ESEKDKLTREKDLVKTWFYDMQERSLAIQSQNDSLRHEIKHLERQLERLKEENQRLEAERQAATGKNRKTNKAK
ncbi:MAG: hypothetical protein II623_04610, partial [Paludibacteraceae bacterium]|nr:hypothetical protein [Paludibacteraceae bacterium]